MNILKLGVLIVALLAVGATGFIGCSGNGATVSSLAVTPTNPMISTVTTTLQYQVTATLSDGTALPSWQLVTWSSPTFASISSTPGSIGLVTPVATGPTTTVTAFDVGHPNISAAASLTVTNILTSITFIPSNPTISIAATTTQQFQALWNSGPLIIPMNQLTWSSSDPTVATISNTLGSQGLATLVSIGTTTITATELYTSFTSNPGSALTVTY